MKHPTSFRLSERALRLLRLLSERLHRSQAATLEVLIEERAGELLEPNEEGVVPLVREGTERPEG
jgi:hypothetical protein